MDLNKLVSELTIADKICLYNTLYEDLACKGIDGDTELAHVNKEEMAVLRAMGGSGTINPNTNLVQFGGGGSPPPPPPATSTVTQQATIPEELKPFITDILEKSKAIQERREEEGYVPFQGPRLADFTEEQQTAFEGIKDLQGAGEPFYDLATGLTASSAQAPTSASVNEFMNPFIQNVIDVQTREALRQGDVERQNIGSQAVQAGGFGGSRHAILEAEQARNLQQRLGDIQARGQAAAFEDAQARLQQQRERERQAGAQFMGLGTQVPGQRLREITGLEAVGAQKQALGQAGIDIAAQEFEIGRSFPERTLQDYQSIVRGYAQPIPASTLQRQSSQQPAPSFLSQAAGLGAAGLGAFKAFGGNAQGGLVGLAQGGLPAGGTVLESQTEAISERAQNDPLTQPERQPLSQTQQFVRGQENEEAATVEEQLKQIQGLALGATNAIAQGQQKLASMNTAPGMGAQPANFGGNVGSFGFKKGGLLALKHLANGGIVRLAAGKQPRTAPDDFNMSDTVKILYNMTDEEFRNPENLKRFNILDVQEAIKQRRLRQAFPPQEKSLSSSLRQRGLPSEGALGFGYDVKEPEGVFAKRLLGAIGATDSNLLKVDPEVARRQLTVSDPGGAPTLPEEKSPFSQDISRQVESLKKMVNPLAQPVVKAGQHLDSKIREGGEYLLGTSSGLAAQQKQTDKLGRQLTADARYLAGKDIDDLVSDSFIKSGLTDVPQYGPMKGRPIDEERFRQFDTVEGRAAEEFARQKAAQKGKTVTPIEKEIDARRQRMIAGGSTPNERKALEDLAIKSVVEQGQESMPTAAYPKRDLAFPKDEQQAMKLGQAGPDLGQENSNIVPLTSTFESESESLDAPQLPGENVIGAPDMEQLGLESIDEIMQKGAGGQSDAEIKVRENFEANIGDGGVAAEVELLNTTTGQFIGEAESIRNSPEYRKVTEINEKLKEATGKERELLQKQLDEGGEVEKGYALMDLGFGILAQPGGQAFLETIGKGAKDSKFTTKLAKLSDKQKKLALDFAKLDRRELQDELGLSKHQATMVMEGRKIDVQKRVADAQLRNATTKQQAAAAKAKLNGLEFQLKEMKHYMDASKFKMDTKDQISFATESFKSAIDLDNLTDSDKKLLTAKGYNPTKNFFGDTTGEDVTEDSKNVNEWIGFYNVALGNKMSPTNARKFATTEWIKGLTKYSK